MNYKYYIFGVGNKDDSIDFDNGRTDDLEFIAERAAEHHWKQSDPDSSWPIELILVDEVGTESAFQVEMEFMPEFLATEYLM